MTQQELSAHMEILLDEWVYGDENQSTQGRMRRSNYCGNVSEYLRWLNLEETSSRENTTIIIFLYQPNLGAFVIIIIGLRFSPEKLFIWI